MENPVICPITDTRLDSAEKIFRYIKPIFEQLSDWDLGREHFFSILLDARMNVIATDLVSKGTSFETIVTPLEAFRLAIVKQAKYVAFVHNHPSGVLLPSWADVNMTRRLIKAGEILDIKVLDHIIFTNNSFVSISEQAMGVGKVEINV